jgi:hypothetical protein
MYMQFCDFFFFNLNSPCFCYHLSSIMMSSLNAPTASLRNRVKKPKPSVNPVIPPYRPEGVVLPASIRRIVNANTKGLDAPFDLDHVAKPAAVDAKNYPLGNLWNLKHTNEDEEEHTTILIGNPFTKYACAWCGFEATGNDPFSAMSKHLTGHRQESKGVVKVVQGCSEFMIHCHPVVDIFQYCDGKDNTRYCCKFRDEFNRPLEDEESDKNEFGAAIQAETDALRAEFERVQQPYGNSARRTVMQSTKATPGELDLNDTKTKDHFISQLSSDPLLFAQFQQLFSNSGQLGGSNVGAPDASNTDDHDGLNQGDHDASNYDHDEGAKHSDDEDSNDGAPKAVVAYNPKAAAMQASLAGKPRRKKRIATTKDGKGKKTNKKNKSEKGSAEDASPPVLRAPRKGRGHNRHLAGFRDDDDDE